MRGEGLAGYFALFLVSASRYETLNVELEEKDLQL